MATASDLSAPADGFREEARSWLTANFPAELSGTRAPSLVDGVLQETTAQTVWRKAFGARGWGVPTWPEAYGGGGVASQPAHKSAATMK